MNSKNIETAFPSFAIYADTDSAYYSATQFFSPIDTEENKYEKTILLAKRFEQSVNNFYGILSKRAFNCDTHKFHIKGESVAKTGLWIAKKRYALNKVYDLETNSPASKLIVKGMDVVRSSFPKAFKDFTVQMITNILNRVEKSTIDADILEFQAQVRSLHYHDIARNTSANNITKYDTTKDSGIAKFTKKTPIGVKSAISHNRLLKQFGIDTKYAPIVDGEKIKYVFVKPNKYKLNTVAFRGEDDAPEILKFIEDFVDPDAQFDNELSNKLDDFYSALGWGNIPTKVNQAAASFFSF